MGLIGLIGGVRALLFLGVAIALGGYVLWLRADAASARLEAVQSERLADHWRGQAADYQRASEATAAAMKRLQEEARRAEQVLRRERDRARAQAELNESIAREILNAPDSDSGPAAPVLDRTLDRLQRGEPDPGGPGPASGSGSPGGEGDAALGPSGMQ